jgi:hypothetical protein
MVLYQTLRQSQSDQQEWSVSNSKTIPIRSASMVLYQTIRNPNQIYQHGTVSDYQSIPIRYSASMVLYQTIRQSQSDILPAWYYINSHTIPICQHVILSNSQTIPKIYQHGTVSNSHIIPIRSASIVMYQTLRHSQSDLPASIKIKNWLKIKLF